MVDTPVVESPAVETPVNAPVIAPETNYFGSDGVLKEGWQGTLDENLREDDTLKLFKNVGDLAKSYVNVRGMVGKDTIAVPKDTSPKDEWSEYYRHGGRPDTVEDYGLAVPEGFPPEFAEKVFPADRIAKWQQRFFDGGVSKKAATQFIAEFANDMLVDMKSAKQAEESKMAELKSGLSLEYGSAIEQKTHIGNIAIEEGTKGDTEFKQRLTDKFGNDPDFVRYSVNLGEKFAEGKSPDFAAIPTPSDLQTQIDELMTNPILFDRNSTLAQRKVITDKIMVLRDKMTATKTG